VRDHSHPFLAYKKPFEAAKRLSNPRTVEALPAATVWPDFNNGLHSAARNRMRLNPSNEKAFLVTRSEVAVMTATAYLMIALMMGNPQVLNFPIEIQSIHNPLHHPE
jgi:hypothetical protein